MLSPLQEALLNDLAEQTSALTLDELKKLNPKYNLRVIKPLLENKMLYKDFSSCEDAFDPSYRISETGKAELLSAQQVRKKESEDSRREQILKSICENTEALDDLKRIADAAEKRAIFAEKEAQSAKTEARKSRRQSLFANILAIVAIAATIFAWLIPRESVISFLLSITS